MEMNFHPFINVMERNVKTNCDICGYEFTIMTRQHVCKRCYRSVCYDCSQFKTKVYSQLHEEALHRMCKVCHTESELIHKYVQVNHLKWGEDSDLVKMWLRKLGLKQVPKRRNTEKKQIKSFVQFENLWNSFNFSFRQFIGVVAEDGYVKPKQITELINIGLTELHSHKVGSLQNATYLLIFFLAHSHVSNAVYFTLCILQLIEHEQPSAQNIAYFLQSMHCSQIEIYKMETIIEETFERTMQRATVNIFPTELTLEIVPQMLIRRDFQELEKGVAFVLSQRKQFVCQHYKKPQQIFLDILRNTTSQEYRKTVKELEGDKSGRSDTKSLSIYDDRKYQKLLKEKDELLMKVRMQEDELRRLREECRKWELKERQSAEKKSIMQRRQSPPNFLMDSYSSMQQYDPYSTESGEETTYNEILQKKNQQIVVLKKQLSIAKDSIKQTTKQITTKEEGNPKITQREQELKQKEEQLSKAKQENEAIKNMNKRLLLKMHELSNLLMDKEEKQVNESSKKMNELMSGLQEIDKQEIKKDCTIF